MIRASLRDGKAGTFCCRRSGWRCLREVRARHDSTFLPRVILLLLGLLRLLGCTCFTHRGSQKLLLTLLHPHSGRTPPDPLASPPRVAGEQLLPSVSPESYSLDFTNFFGKAI